MCFICDLFILLNCYPHRRAEFKNRATFTITLYWDFYRSLFSSHIICSFLNVYIHQVGYSNNQFKKLVKCVCHSNSAEPLFANQTFFQFKIFKFESFLSICYPGIHLCVCFPLFIYLWPYGSITYSILHSSQRNQRIPQQSKRWSQEPDPWRHLYRRIVTTQYMPLSLLSLCK